LRISTEQYFQIETRCKVAISLKIYNLNVSLSVLGAFHKNAPSGCLRKFPEKRQKSKMRAKELHPSCLLFREDQRVHNPSDDPVRETAGTITTGKEQAL
jgi:hypothetical protein